MSVAPRPLFNESAENPSRTHAENDVSALYSSLDELVGWRFHVKQRRLNSPQKVMDQVNGSHQSLRKGSGMIFSEVRQYQPGDDIRHIDWRVSARTQKVHTKLFTEEYERPTVIVAEQTPALFFGSQVRLKAAQVLNIASILGWIALQQNDQIGGLSFNQNQQAWVSPKRSKTSLLNWTQQSLKLQRTLTQPGSANPKLWQSASHQLVKLIKPGSKVFLIGDMLNLDSTSLNHLHSLRQHNEITAIHVFDPLEKRLPKLGWLSLTSGWLGEQLLPLNSRRSETRKRYRENYKSRWEQTQTQLRKLQIPLVEIATHEDPLAALLKKQVIR